MFKLDNIFDMIHLFLSCSNDWSTHSLSKRESIKIKSCLKNVFLGDFF